MAKIEFYVDMSKKHIAVLLDEHAVPRKSEIVNIRKQLYRVASVNWCVDHESADFYGRLRACVEVVKVKQ